MTTKNLFSLDCDVPPGHQKTPTEDGTFTLENLTFQENCHSTAGAYQETLFNYIQGTEIQKKLHLPEINIFEVGFGLGFGPIATFEKLAHYPGKINFYSSEIDENLINWFRDSSSEEINQTFPYRHLKLAKDCEVPTYQATSKNRELRIFIGDLDKIKGRLKLNNIHAIYQDPFSPKKNPTLWTQEWFSFLKSISSPEVVLSTYSASHSVHEHLKASGWFVYRAPGFAHKRSSTRATLSEGAYQGPVK